MTLDDIYSEMSNAKSVAIMAHVGPDGDAIGSCLAMGLAARDLGIETVDVLMKEYPKNFSYLPGIELIKEEPTLEEYDMAIVLDCPDIQRVHKDFWTVFDNANVKVEFDHHNKNAMFGDYNIVDSSSPACAQILVSSFEYLKIELTKDIMVCLLTGIITDTGGFRNSNISEATFDFAGYALSKGINVSKIYREALTTMPKSKFAIHKIATSRLEFLYDGKVTYTYVTKEDDESVGVEPGDHEGIVEIGRDIEGVEVSIFICEKEEGFKASLRSNDYVNVSEICTAFGGGGHVRAAGATLTQNLEESKNLILKEVEKHLN